MPITTTLSAEVPTVGNSEEREGPSEDTGHSETITQALAQNSDSNENLENVHAYDSQSQNPETSPIETEPASVQQPSSLSEPEVASAVQDTDYKSQEVLSDVASAADDVSNQLPAYDSGDPPPDDSGDPPPDDSGDLPPDDSGDPPPDDSGDPPPDDSGDPPPDDSGDPPPDDSRDPLPDDSGDPPPAPSKGFQDAFAAFASAALNQSNEQIEETVAEGNQVFDAAPPNAVVTEQIGDPNFDVFSSGSTAQTQQLSQEQTQLEESDHSQPEQQQQGASETQSQMDIPPEGIEQQQPQDSQAVSDSVFFIQGTDATGQIVTSIIDPNDISSYMDSVVYKQSMMANGEIETTIVHSGTSGALHEQQQQLQMEQQQQQPQEESQIIYAQDVNGQLTPIDSSQSANDVAPPGKQFVYMQDSTGRIIRTIMDANQTMVPGQQVYYTQSDDGRIITSVMDPTSSTEEQQQPTAEEQATYQQQKQSEHMVEDVAPQQRLLQQDSVAGAANYNLDSGLSGLNMLAELSHLTAGQAPTTSGLPTDSKGTSSTDSNSADMDEFRPVAMVTRRIGAEEGIEDVSSTIAELKVDQQESPVYKLISELKPELQSPALSVSRDNLFVQWQNLDAMCWMDVVLIMLVYSPTLRPLVNLDPGHELASTLLITLLKANRQAQVLVQNLLKKSNGAEITGLQTGAGNTATTSMQDPKTAKLVCKENMDEIGKAINILYAMREKIWQALQPRLRCERGKHNSPVLVLPLLVREKPAIKQMFTMSYRYVFKCERCGYTQDDNHTKILPSIPAVPEDFNMKEPCFVRNCFECQAPNQRMLMKFEGLQDFVQMHFVKGLPHNRFDELCFDFNGDHYEVTAVVHYKNNPDHFIAWVRNAPGSLWMECDDLKSVITRYQHSSPPIPASQVHMVMWERCLTPVHQLQMRDTEDTKVLASLVLTVQQPSTHQTTDPAAKPTGQPSTLGFPNTNTPAKTSTLLSGVLNQFSPYTPRGRGRGSRGRGRGVRGATAATSSTTIRRTTPISLTGTGTSSPQIVRLPMSALGSGASAGATKYVLMGNSGSGASATGSASKVVVVRSQGGASNLTAQQLLQLLQQTGAISQAGAKIAITNSAITTTAATGVTAQTTVATKGSTSSYIIQSDGTIVTSSDPVAQSTQTAPVTSSTLSSDTSLGGRDPTVKLVSVLPQALASLSSTYSGIAPSTEPEQDTSASHPMLQDIPSEEPMDTSQAATTPEMPQEESPMEAAKTSQAVSEGTPLTELGTTQATEANPALISPESTNTPTEIATTTSTVSQQQPGTSSASRYIQIPTSDGGSILTHLVVRNGKMVLVPVDKATQALAQAQPSAVLRLSGTATKPVARTGVATTTTSTASVAGSIFSQFQQQQPQTESGTSSSLTSVLTSASPGTALITKGDQRFITMPSTHSTSAGKRTIQLISVPRGAGQQGSKTIILNPAANITDQQQQQQQLALDTTLSTMENSAPSQGRILSQEGNIVIRELRRPDTSPATLTTTLVGSQESDLMSTPAVSLLKDVSARSGGHSTVSLLGTSQRQAETFKYILPGSNTTHVLHTGSGLSGQASSRAAFTALSSSGKIIGGQLTPSMSSAGTCTMEQELGLPELDDSTPDYITMGKSRPRGRGSRGGRGSRSRGGPRGGRGRGRGHTPSSQLWSSMEMMTPSDGQTMSTLSELRQVGAHVIQSGTENVDGIPVLSIPEFPETGQTEANAAAQSIEQESRLMLNPDTVLTHQTGQHQQQEVLPQQDWSSPEATAPRVITQTIPSVKANHGFDILTQGILGSTSDGVPPHQTFKRARSLLTGAEVTTSTMTASEAVQTSFNVPEVSPEPPVQHNETDTLIEAAMAAAKPQQASEVVGEVERHVSAAERYSMPMELFQPDEEMIEKPSKGCEQLSQNADELCTAQTGEVDASSQDLLAVESTQSEVTEDVGSGAVQSEGVVHQEKGNLEFVSPGAPVHSGDAGVDIVSKYVQSSHEPHISSALTAGSPHKSPTGSMRSPLKSPVGSPYRSPATGRSDSFRIKSPPLTELEFQTSETTEQQEPITEMDTDIEVEDQTQKPKSKKRGRKSSANKSPQVSRLLSPGPDKNTERAEKSDNLIEGEETFVSVDVEANEETLDSTLPVEMPEELMDTEEVQSPQGHQESYFKDCSPFKSPPQASGVSPDKSPMRSPNRSNSPRIKSPLPVVPEISEAMGIEDSSAESDLQPAAPKTKLQGRSSGKRGKRKSGAVKNLKRSNVLGPVKDENTQANIEYSHEEEKSTVSVDVAVTDETDLHISQDDSIVKVPTSRTAGGFGADVLKEMGEAPEAVSRGIINKSSALSCLALLSPENSTRSQPETSNTADLRQEEETAIDVEDPSKEQFEDKSAVILEAEKLVVGKVATMCSEAEVVEVASNISFNSRYQVNWTLPWVEVERPRFSYKELTGRRRPMGLQHSPCLISPCHESVRKEKLSMDGKALVKRLHRKVLQSPRKDPLKQPTIVPMGIGENEEASTGGSVITSPIDGEVFVGVIVSERKEPADWTCSSSPTDIEEGEDDGNWDISWSPEELRLAQASYCQHLFLGLFMQAGDLSSLLEWDNEDSSSESNEVLDFETDGDEPLGDKTEEPNFAQDHSHATGHDSKAEELKPDISHEADHKVEGAETSINDPGSSFKRKRGRPPKKKEADKETASPQLPMSRDTPPTKRQRLSQEDSAEENGFVAQQDASKKSNGLASQDSLLSISSRRSSGRPVNPSSKLMDPLQDSTQHCSSTLGSEGNSGANSKSRRNKKEHALSSH